MNSLPPSLTHSRDTHLQSRERPEWAGSCPGSWARNGKDRLFTVSREVRKGARLHGASVTVYGARPPAPSITASCVPLRGSSFLHFPGVKQLPKAPSPEAYCSQIFCGGRSQGDSTVLECLLRAAREDPHDRVPEGGVPKSSQGHVFRDVLVTKTVGILRGGLPLLSKGGK